MNASVAFPRRPRASRVTPRRIPAATLRKARETAPVFAALADSTRIGLLGRLAAGGTQSIAALTIGTGLTRQAITKHLTVLERARVVKSRREGRERRWMLDPVKLESARRTLALLCGEWNARGRRA